jgi:hypothetical protein
MTRCGCQSRDSVASSGLRKSSSEHSQGGGAATFQEWADLFALTKERFHNHEVGVDRELLRWLMGLIEEMIDEELSKEK